MTAETDLKRSTKTRKDKANTRDQTQKFLSMLHLSGREMDTEINKAKAETHPVMPTITTTEPSPVSTPAPEQHHHHRFGTYFNNLMHSSSGESTKEKKQNDKKVTEETQVAPELDVENKKLRPLSGTWPKAALSAAAEQRSTVSPLIVQSPTYVASPSAVRMYETTPFQVDFKAPGTPNTLRADPHEPLPIDYDNNPFQRIHNFRDIGANYNRDSGTKTMKEGVFFRSNLLDYATNEDLSLLVDKYNVTSVIDLRAETEGTMGEVLLNAFPSNLLKTGLCPKTTKDTLEKHMDDLKAEGKTKRRRIRLRREVKDLEEHHEKVEGEKGKQSTYFVNFAGTNYRIHCILNPLPFTMKCKVAQLMAQHRKPEVVKLVGATVLSPQGLAGMYRGFVDYCGEEIVTALKIMATQENYPILVHCTQGKDRTGLVCAMALHCAGIPEEYILKDYARSQKGLDDVRDIMVAEMAKTGLGPEFTDAPAYVLRQTFAYIRQNYGSVDKYLENFGLLPGFRSTIASRLLIGK